ncbi:MAG: hypothetical protein IKL66_01180 [Clostridia bacterium]|nr:hypothetical protein [Clostridia bacterium]
MKKKEFLQDSIGLIDDDIVKEAKDEPRRKSTPWVRLIAVAACVAILAAAIPVGFLIADRATPQIDGGQETENNSEKTDATVDTTPQFDENGREIWLDNRKYKEGLKPYGEELAYEWSWEYLDIYEKFWLIDVNDDNYYYVNEKIPEDLLGEYLGEMIAYGYDDFGDGGRYEIDCVAYSIKGAPDNDAIAVKLEGTDEFVVYSIFRYKFDPPKTFGEMIALKNLSENVSFLNYYYDHDEDVWTAAKKYELSIEQSDHVWKIFTEKCADAEAIKYEDYHGSGQKISLVVSSDILPMNGFAIEVYAEGYIKTNIFRYGSCFFIGKSAANEIIEYVLTNPKEAPEITDKWVAGTITEIGEDYFKINDAPMMENEEDGIEFTVKTTDIKLLRYFKAGILKVGDTAIVKYNGNIYADDPTTIDSAYSLYECQIHSGDVYIPE